MLVWLLGDSSPLPDPWRLADLLLRLLPLRNRLEIQPCRPDESRCFASAIAVPAALWGANGSAIVLHGGNGSNDSSSRSSNSDETELS